METLAEELEVSIYRLGSTTFKRPEVSRAEPDKCFYIQNIKAIQDKKRLDMNQDPPPDLVVEIDITSCSGNSLEVYADLAVPEVWIYNGDRLTINILENQEYTAYSKFMKYTSFEVLFLVDFERANLRLEKLNSSVVHGSCLATLLLFPNLGNSDQYNGMALCSLMETEHE